jgi:hypothetical protein
VNTLLLWEARLLLQNQLGGLVRCLLIVARIFWVVAHLCLPLLHTPADWCLASTCSCDMTPHSWHCALALAFSRLVLQRPFWSNASCDIMVGDFAPSITIPLVFLSFMFNPTLANCSVWSSANFCTFSGSLSAMTLSLTWKS